MCNALFSCPLCSVPRFHDLETFRVALIKVATENLPCPICKEVYMGLDKLTIHLFSHRESDVKTKPNQTSLEDEGLISDRDTNSSPISESNNNESALSEDVREYRKRKNKSKKISNPSKSTIIAEDISDNATSPQSLPVFNMNTIPFIGIPHQNIDLPKTKTTKQSEKRKNRSDRLSEKCDICGFFFLGKNILEMHKKLIHNIHNSQVVNGIAHYCCHICSKVFKMKGSLMVHLRMVHFAIIPSVNEETDEKYEDSKSDMETLKEDSNSNIQKTAATDKPLDSGGESTGKTWKCDICEKNFTTKYFLKKHKRLHTGEMPYSCTQCNKTFTFQQSYHKHLLYHNDEKPHTCSHCGRGFKELSTLHNHQRIHTGEKPFECETCGKCFRQRVSYLVHRRIHTGAMPYKCTACDKSFRYKVSQRMHKCTAQPPGTVIRQSGELVQKLLKNQMDLENAKIEGDIQSNVSMDHIVKKCSEPFETVNKISMKHEDIPMSHDDILVNICNPSFVDVCNMNFTDKSSSSDERNCIIDEIVKESISQIDFSDPKPSTSTDFHRDVGDLYSIVSQNIEHSNDNMDESLPSPSEKMKNLKLNAVSPNSMENENMPIKDYDKDDISYIFELPSTRTLNCYHVKDKDIDFTQSNMECHDIFPNR